MTVTTITDRRLEERIEQLEQALDHLLHLVDAIEDQGIIWREWFREVVEEARRAQAGGKVQDQ